MSALADGILGGFSSVAAFGQQQTQNKLAQDKLALQRENFEEQGRQYDQNYEIAQKNLTIAQAANKREQSATDIAQAESDRKTDSADLDIVLGDLLGTGWINLDNPAEWNGAENVKKIEAGGQVVDNMILTFAKRDPDLPDGFTPDTVDRTDGGIIISGSYPDGRKGVFTVDGKVTDDAEVAAISPEQLSQLMSNEWTMNMIGRSSMGKSSEYVAYLVAKGVGKADANALSARHKAEATLQTTVTAKITEAAEQMDEAERVGMKRAFTGALASAKTPQEKLAILTDQAETMGIEVPSILLEAPEEVDKNSVEGRLAEAGITPAVWEEMSEVEKEEALEQTAKGGKGIKQAAIAAVTGGGQFGKPVPKITMDQATDSFTAIANQSAEVKKASEELQTGMFSQIDGMTPEEVIEYIDGGGFKSSGEDEAKLAKVLQEAQVETMDDIKRLPTTAQIATRAWLYSIAPDGQKTAIAKEITNLGTGGTAASSANQLEETAIKQQTADIQRQNANTSSQNAITSRGNLENTILTRQQALRKHDWDVAKDTGTKLSTVFTDLDNAIYELDDEGNPTSTIDYNEKTFFAGMSGPNGALVKVRRLFAGAEDGSPDKAALRSATNSLYSIGIQTMAESEEYGSFSENFLPDGSISFIDGNDRFLSRVFVAERDKYGPTRFGIRSLGSNAQLDETISAGTVKQLFGQEGYKDFLGQLTTGSDK